MDKYELYALALSKWGSEAQFNMVIEEAMELALITSRHIRGRATFAEIVDEIADMEIMLDQYVYIMRDYDIRRAIDERKLFKLKRLEEKVLQ